MMIKFAGSFQCRLAVGFDHTDDSPTDPLGVYGSRGQGGTFAYQEKRFDRIIRLNDPVQLRTALIDDWEGAWVRSVLVGDDFQLENDNMNPLNGGSVSLGSTAKFEEDGPYQIVDVDFSIGGGTLFRGRPLGPVPQSILMQDRGLELQQEYIRKKLHLIRGSNLDPIRKRVLTDGDGVRVVDYGLMFRKYAQYDTLLLPATTRLPRPIDHKKFGKADDAQNYLWFLSFTLDRWDGDTLTGRVSGTLIASHRSLWADVTTTIARLTVPYLRWLSQ